eukprot:3845806-Pleurochrysis_carterae.AAC.1
MKTYYTFRTKTYYMAYSVARTLSRALIQAMPCGDPRNFFISRACSINARSMTRVATCARSTRNAEALTC